MCQTFLLKHLRSIWSMNPSSLAIDCKWCSRWSLVGFGRIYGLLSNSIHAWLTKRTSEP
jgi:hypothetical protein